MYTTELKTINKIDSVLYGKDNETKKIIKTAINDVLKIVNSDFKIISTSDFTQYQYSRDLLAIRYTITNLDFVIKINIKTAESWVETTRSSYFLEKSTDNCLFKQFIKRRIDF